MTWDGDIGAMGQLAERVADLATVPSRASKRIAGEIADLIELEFEGGADPYGTAWAPLEESTLERRSQTTEPPLTDHGFMRGSVRVRPLQGAGIGITIQNPPAAPHQTGWAGSQGSGPARPILPSGEMPPLWQEAIDQAIDEEVRR